LLGYGCKKRNNPRFTDNGKKIWGKRYHSCSYYETHFKFHALGWQSTFVPHSYERTCIEDV